MTGPTAGAPLGRVAPAPFRLSGQDPVLEPLAGGSILANVVVNLEHWSLDRPMPRAILPPPHGLQVVPDVANHSWVLYGLRAGLPRLAAALAPLGRNVSVALNSSVIDVYPDVADLVADLGWEVLGHGVEQRSVHGVDDEVAMIGEATEALTARFGTPPRGWLSPGMNQTDESLARLVGAGYAYCHDWMIGDRPAWLSSSAGSILGLPYTVELNDVTTYVASPQPDGELVRRVAASLAVLSREAPANPVVCPIGLHPHVMGVPHRIAEVERIVELLLEAPGLVPVPSGAIAAWYAGQVAE